MFEQHVEQKVKYLSFPDWLGWVRMGIMFQALANKQTMCKGPEAPDKLVWLGGEGTYGRRLACEVENGIRVQFIKGLKRLNKYRLSIFWVMRSDGRGWAEGGCTWSGKSFRKIALVTTCTTDWSSTTWGYQNQFGLQIHKHTMRASLVAGEDGMYSRNI